jgi:hypothetical protein
MKIIYVRDQAHGNEKKTYYLYQIPGCKTNERATFTRGLHRNLPICGGEADEDKVRGSKAFAAVT